MENKEIKRREDRVRRQLRKHDLLLRKSRTDGCSYDRNGIFQGYRPHDRGGYAIIDECTAGVVAGGDFELSLEAAEDIVKELA